MIMHKECVPANLLIIMMLYLQQCTVFNPCAPSNRSPLKSAYEKHEKEKCRAYEERVIQIEHGSFTPATCILSLRRHGTSSTSCVQYPGSQLNSLRKEESLIIIREPCTCLDEMCAQLFLAEISSQMHKRLTIHLQEAKL